MNRLVVKVFILLTFVLFIKCDSVDSSVAAPMHDTVEVLKSSNTTSIDRRVEKSSGAQQSEEDLLIKQLAGFPDLPPFLETMRSYFKLAYKSYVLLQPEIKFGQCLVKYFYMRFPRVMRYFQWQNLSKYIRRVYVVSGRMANNVVTRTVFKWFDDTELDRERIAIKMAAITSEKPITPLQSIVRPIYEIYESLGLQPQSELIQGNYPNLFRSTTRLRRRIQREAKYPSTRDRNNVNGQNQKAEIHYKRNMKREEMQSKNMMRNALSSEQKGAKNQVEMNSDAIIDLTNKAVEREAEELFNIDTMFWRSLGFEDSSFKRYSLAYCTKEYVTDSFSRFMKNIILS